jgi:transposase-like protein
MRTRRPRPAPTARSAFAGFRFPPDVIVLAVRWYLRFGLSYRDVEELLVERGIEVDHVTIYRWVQRFTPLLAEAARAGTPSATAGSWTRPGEGGRPVAVGVPRARPVRAGDRRVPSARRQGGCRFVQRAIGTTKLAPVAVITDRAATYPIVLEDLLAAPWHRTERYANNRIEADTAA